MEIEVPDDLKRPSQLIFPQEASPRLVCRRAALGPFCCLFTARQEVAWRLRRSPQRLVARLTGSPPCPGVAPLAQRRCVLGCPATGGSGELFPLRPVRQSDRTAASLPLGTRAYLPHGGGGAGWRPQAGLLECSAFTGGALAWARCEGLMAGYWRR
ncbi:hypothetical protein NDU88_003941 [Pleurodeles waltl]|uniref:Uncharacterized protein n=1 Tax=Pleurodeles waltl TaxID=8319 RepID=A0AAV7QB47_PLEWA|nr:hypothetical protein NDU88_003941 [Pleurodeles waltl]